MADEHYLQLVLEVEALLGGGQQFQAGLPTVLQTVMSTFHADTIGLTFWQDPPPIRLDFPIAYGQTQFLLSQSDPLISPQHEKRTPSQIWKISVSGISIAYLDGLQNRYGVLQLVSQKEPNWEPSERLALQLIGRQIGIALENAITFEHMQRQSIEIDWLNKVGDSLLSLMSSLHLDKVVGRIMNAVKDLLDVEETSILLTTPESQDLVLWKHTPPERDLNFRLRPGEGIAGWVMETGKSAIVNDVHSDSRWFSDVDAQGDFRTRSLIAVPIILEEGVVGVIEAINKINGDFTEADEGYLQSLTVWAGIAITNANTYNELKYTHERLSDTRKQAAMAQMVLNLTHRINNSVGAIRVWAMDMQKAFDTNSPESQTINMIFQNAQETLKLVRRIRGATEPNTGAIRAVEIETVLETAIHAANLPATIQIQKHYEVDPTTTIAADMERLAEVFINLMTNAGDAMGAKGTLTLTLRHTAQDMIEIVIQDTAPGGIAEHLRPNLFDPFTTTKTDGMGLGLWMVKNYLEFIGGTITLNYSSSDGSRFRILLPVWKEDK